MSRLVHGGAIVSALLLAGGDEPARQAAPLRLAVYYGYPSLVNGARGDSRRAARVFADYDIVVFGDGLEFARDGHGAGAAEHAATKTIIQQLRSLGRRPTVYGYVDLGATQRLIDAELVHRIDRWGEMGAGGVLLDEAGFDFGVTRERQNLAIAAAHARGMSACLNAFDPADLFGTARVPLNAAGGGNPEGLAPVLTGRDAVLLESFAVSNGNVVESERLLARVRAAVASRATTGTRVFGLATGRERVDPDLAASGWWAAAVFGLDAYGWGTAAYGAPTSTLPWIQRPQAEAVLERARFTGDADVGSRSWRRATTVGTIVVDARVRTGRLERGEGFDHD